MMRLPQRLEHPVGLGAMGPIVEAVAEAFGVTVRELRGDSKARALCDARACAYVVGRACTPFSYSELGTAFGHRHHTTIMSGEVLGVRLIGKDARFAAVVNGLIERFSVKVGAA
jgi:chromosomal replication initiation ATPase DnaA